MLNFIRRLFSKPTIDPLPVDPAPAKWQPDRYRRFFVAVIPSMVALTFKYKALLGDDHLIDKVSFSQRPHPTKGDPTICVVFTIDRDLLLYTDLCSHIETNIRKVASWKDIACFSISEYTALSKSE